MFESALIEHKLAKEEYDREEPALRTKLLGAQLKLLEQKDFSVVIVVTGMDGAGKGEVIHRLMEWLDPRHVRVAAYESPDDAERSRPRMWRYWRDLPPRGDISVVFGSWYSDPLRDRLVGESGKGRFERELGAINRFEEMLADEGTVLFKFLLVVSVAEQKRRLKALNKGPAVPAVRLRNGRTSKRDGRQGRSSRRSVRRTSTGRAPWIVLASDDPEYRDLSFGRLVLAGLEQRLDRPALKAVSSTLAIPNVDTRNLLDTLDLTRSLAKAEYKRRLEAAQSRLLALCEGPRFAGRALVIAFEGHDAAGKGGAIRRLTRRWTRATTGSPVAAPTDEEKRRTPICGGSGGTCRARASIAIFDRSWYGRVLVERVEGFAPPSEWQRAYGEINDFEEQLTARRHPCREVLAGDQPGGAAAPFRGPRGRPTTSGSRSRPRTGATATGGTHYQAAVGEMIERTSTRVRTLDPGRGRRQEMGAGEGAGDAGRTARREL